MLILSVRTDKPEAELSLFNNDQKLDGLVWQAHRELAETIHLKISELLVAEQLEMKNIQGIVAFKGPGSFTGLRIGLSVANALADGLDIPIVTKSGENWLGSGITALLKGRNDRPALPDYGAPPKTTRQRK
jgi:tRNA threonylcarbamoyladenosine biosynthesis protein TsaB